MDYLRSLRDDEDLFGSILKKGKEDGVPLVSLEVASFLRFIVGCLKSRKLCELGSGYGYSTFSMAYSMREHSVLHTVDSSVNSFKFIQNEIDKRGLSGKVIPFHETALTFLKRMENSGESFDLYFIDAVKGEYLEYLKIIEKIIEPGGILIFDNVLWKGEVARKSDSSKAVSLRSFNKYFMQNSLIESTILSIGDGLAVGYFSPNKKICSDLK